MNEESVYQKLTQALLCMGHFYDAGLHGKITNSVGLKKNSKKSVSLAYCLDLLLNYP